jgi:hypothetical protein
MNDYAIPEPYRHPQYYAEWEREFKPRLAECATVVRRIHETTPHEDDAEPAYGDRSGA